MSRIILAMFLLTVLVVIVSEAQKCRRYETICYPRRGCRTRCIRRGRRDVSEALQGALEDEQAARDLEDNVKRFEEEKRDVDDDDAIVVFEDARDVDDDDELQEDIRSLYEEYED